MANVTDAPDPSDGERSRSARRREAIAAAAEDLEVALVAQDLQL